MLQVHIADRICGRIAGSRSLIATRSCFIESRSRSVTVSLNSGRFFAERIEIDCDPKRCASFVLPAITPADGAAFIVENMHYAAEGALRPSRALPPVARLDFSRVEKWRT